MATSGGEEAAAASAPAPGAPATGTDTTPGWEVAVRPLLSASYSAFEMKELPQLVASVIERYRAAAPAGRRRGGGDFSRARPTSRTASCRSGIPTPTKVSGLPALGDESLSGASSVSCVDHLCLNFPSRAKLLRPPLWEGVAGHI